MRECPPNSAVAVTLDSLSWHRHYGLFQDVKNAYQDVGIGSSRVAETVRRSLFIMVFSCLEGYATASAEEALLRQLNASLAGGQVDELRGRYERVWGGLAGRRKSKFLSAFGESLNGGYQRDRLQLGLSADLRVFTFNRVAPLEAWVQLVCGMEYSPTYFWTGVCEAGEFESCSQVKNTLELAVERRNHIAHSGDHPSSTRLPMHSESLEIAMCVVESLLHCMEQKLQSSLYSS